VAVFIGVKIAAIQFLQMDGIEIARLPFRNSADSVEKQTDSGKEKRWKLFQRLSSKWIL
jgi:hypothetical protein